MKINEVERAIENYLNIDFQKANDWLGSKRSIALLKNEDSFSTYFKYNSKYGRPIPKM